MSVIRTATKKIANVIKIVKNNIKFTFLLRGENMDVKKLKPFNFLNIFNIERTTDILALTAFLLSVLTLTPQVAKFFDKSNIIVYLPDHITIVSHDFSNSIRDRVRFAVSLTYENKGNPRYSDVIKKEFARMEIFGKDNVATYDFIWSENISINDNPDDQTKLVIQTLSQSAPAKVAGGEIITHLTYFTPCPLNRKNYLKWEEFIKLTNKSKKIKFTIGFSTFGGETKSIACMMKLSNITTDLLSVDKNKWLQQTIFHGSLENSEPLCQSTADPLLVDK